MRQEDSRKSRSRRSSDDCTTRSLELRQQLNPAIVGRVIVAVLVIVAMAALLETIFGQLLTVDAFAASCYWALTSLLSSGDSGFATGPAAGLIYG